MIKQSIGGMRILKKEREKVLKGLSKYRDIMRGSLVLLERSCGTEKKYPAYFLSKSVQGKTVMRYVRRSEVKKVRGSLNQYKDLKRLIGKLCELNEEIFVLEREI